MGRIDLIKDITQEQLDAKATEATEASEALILEMLNEIKASKDFPVDEQLLPLFNQDLETIFQAFGESVKNQDKYKDQEHFEISTIGKDFIDWLSVTENVSTLKLEFDVNVWKNYLSDLIQLQINKDEEIQSVIGWTQKEIDVVAPVVAKQKSDSENRQEETSNSTPVVNNFIDKYKNSKDWFGQIAQEFSKNSKANPTIKAELIQLLNAKKIKEFQKKMGMVEGKDVSIENRADGVIGNHTIKKLQTYLLNNQTEKKADEDKKSALEKEQLKETIYNTISTFPVATSEEQRKLIERTRTQYTELIEKIDTNNKNIEDATAEFSTIRATFDEERKRLQATNQQQETNRVTLQKKYDANQTRIAELEKAINEHPTTRATVIANAKDKRIPQKQIDDYIAGLDKMDAANKQELAQLKQQQQTLKNAMESNDFLGQADEATVNTFITSVEENSRKNTSQSPSEYQKMEYEQIGDLSLDSYKKLPKNQKKALKLLIKEYKKDVDVDKLSDKEQKELRKLFKNLKDIKLRINGASALRLMDKVRQEKPRPTTVEARKEKILRNVQTTDGRYLWKKGKEKGQERRALERFAKIYFDAYSEIQDENGIPIGSVLHPVFVDFFRETSDADRTGVTEQQLAMSQKQLHNIDTQELSKSLTNAENTLLHLIANLDNNTSLDKKAKEAFSETQVRNAYIDAKRLLYLEKGVGTSLDDPALTQAIIKNIIIAMEHATQGRYIDNLQTIERNFYTEVNGNKVLKEMFPVNLINTFKQYPNLLEVFQNVLRSAGEHIKQVFIEGKDWAQTEEQVALDKEKAQTGGKRKIVQRDNTETLKESAVTPPLPEGVDATIEGRIEGEYSNFLKETKTTLHIHKQRLSALEKKSDLSSKEKEEMEILQALTAPELEKSLQDLETHKKENLKTIKINIVGAMYSRLQEHFEHITKDQNGNITKHDKHTTVKQSVGIGVNITSEKINDYLTKNTAGWIKSLNLTPTLGITDSEQGRPTGVLGIGVSLAGSKELGKNWEMIHAVGGGAGVTTSGQLFAGPWMSIGFLKQFGEKKMKNTLDPKALHQAGVILTATLTGLGVNAVWNKDKLKGIETEMEMIKKDLQGIIGEMIPTSGAVNYDTILNKLKKKFPNTKNQQQISYFAHDLFNLLKPFEEKLKIDGTDTVISQGEKLEGAELTARQVKARNEIIAAKAEQFANMWANQNREQLKKGFLNGFHLSGASIGVILGMSYTPVTAGLKFTRYKNQQWEVDPKSQERANERFQYGYGAKKIQDQTFGTLATRLNDILNDYGSPTLTSDGGEEDKEKQQVSTYIEHDEARGAVKIHKNILEKLHLHLLPELKPYILTEGESILIPDFFPVSFHIHSGEEGKQSHLIIGTLGVKNTQRIVESDFLLFNKNPQTWTERMEEAKMKLGVKPTELTTTTLDNEVLRNKVLENIKKTFREAKVFFNDVQFPIDIENITIQKNADGTYKLSLPAIDGSLFKEIDNLSSLAKVTIKRKLEKQADGTYQEGAYEIDTTPQIPGSHSFEIAYGKEALGSIVTKTETISALALKDSQDEEVLNYFSSPSSTSVLLAIRKQNDGTLKQKIYKAVKAGDHNKIATTIKDFLSKWRPLSNDLTAATDKFDSTKTSPEMLRGNVNFLYAALSRVDATKWKQVGLEFTSTEQNAMLTAADKLIDDGNLNLKLKELFRTRITETAQTAANDGTPTATWNEIEKLLGYSPTTHPNPREQTTRAKLYWMMADVNKIIAHRTSSFGRRLKNEPQFSGNNGANAYNDLINKRADLQKKLNYPFDNAEAKDGSTALVFGYQGEGAGHQEKFVSSPLMIRETSEAIEASQTKRYFLENLQKFDKTHNVFSQTRDKIITTMKGIDNNFNATILDEDIIQALVEKTEIEITVNGKKQKISLSADFKLGFFADCINEAILMSPIEITYTGELQEIQYKEQASSVANKLGEGAGGLSVVTTDVVRNVSLRDKHFVAGAAAGWKNTKTTKVEEIETEGGELPKTEGGDEGQVTGEIENSEDSGDEGSGSVGGGDTSTENSLNIGEETPSNEGSDNNPLGI